MTKNKNVRIAVIVICVLLSLYALWPTFQFYSLSENEKQELNKSAEGTKQLSDLQVKSINLGLDLKGGIRLVYEADLITLFDKLTRNKDAQYNAIFDKAVEEHKKMPDEHFAEILQKQFELENVPMINYWGEKFKDNEGVVKFLNEEGLHAIDRASQIIRNRVDQFGVSEPSIQKLGDNRIIVELPGLEDPKQAKNLIQQTALLEFKLVRDPQEASTAFERIDKYLLRTDSTVRALVSEVKKDTAARSAADTAKAEVSGLKAELAKSSDDTSSADTTGAATLAERPFTKHLIGQQIGQTHYDFYIADKDIEYIRMVLYYKFGDQYKLKPGIQEAIGENNDIHFSTKPVQEGYYGIYVVKKQAELAGAVITEAKQDIYQGMDPGMAGRPIVTLKMTDEGSKKWAIVTGANVGKRIAIVLDNKIQSAPNIIEKISGGNTQITGMDNMEEAKALAIALRAGSLPAPLSVMEERTIGPSLGQDSIDSGKFAGYVAIIIVALVMMIYYRLAGTLANVALLFNLLFLLGILTGFGFTLTLPGIAGIVLTLGMAVDANVLVYERIREEIRLGKTVRASIEAGFSRAFITIIDANLTTFGTGLVLFQFGTGPIKGFALTLMIGIITTIFTAVFATRIFLDLVYDRHSLEQQLSIGIAYDAVKKS